MPNIIMADKGGGDWTTDGFARGTEPSGDIICNVAGIREALFTKNSAMTSIQLPNATSIGQNAFSQCSALLSVDAPLVTSFFNRNYAFSECNACQHYNLPSATIIGTEQFKLNTSLEIISLPSVTDIYNSAFLNCTNLSVVDLGASNTSTRLLRQTIFSGDGNLKTLVLRPTTVVPLSYTSAFVNTPFDSGGSGGTIYIPKVLYDHLGDGTSDDYKAASNWSTIDGYGTITWAKIEGSIYETQYADGTPIPSA